jgi:hypothetical protein
VQGQRNSAAQHTRLDVRIAEQVAWLPTAASAASKAPTQSADTHHSCNEDPRAAVDWGHIHKAQHLQELLQGCTSMLLLPPPSLL